MQGLAELAAAMMRGLRTQVTSMTLGLFLGARLDARPFALADVAIGAFALALAAWSLHGIVRPRWYEAQIKSWKGRLPTTSGIDLGVDAALAGIGIMFWDLSRGGGPSAHALCGLGIAGVAFPGLLALVRVSCWRRRPTA